MRALVTRWMGAAIGLMVSVHALETVAWAGTPNPVPEIGAGSLSAGLGLLTAGILVLRARRSK
jgi:hypothetical protein